MFTNIDSWRRTLYRRIRAMVNDVSLQRWVEFRWESD